MFHSVSSSPASIPFRPFVRIGICLVLFVAVFSSSLQSPIRADQFVLTANRSSPQQVGEIQLLPGPLPMHDGAILPLLYSGNAERSENAITTGELWSFFNRQGLEKVESIVLFLDVDKFSGPDPITIDSIEFRIESASSTNALTSCSLGETNSLVIPGDDSLAAMPEARLEIPLDYDFMKRFSESSNERVFLKITYQSPHGSAPSFFVAGQQALITLPNFTLIAGFVGFWAVVFFGLARFTLKPAPQTAKSRSGS